MLAAREAHREKMLVALSSVGAAVGLTVLKLVAGLLSGSLGILAEAAHSGLDLAAALMTFLAVRVADRPADATHNYGHAKIENLSALFEAILLLATALWIIYEALRRLILGEGHVEASILALVVMAISIAVDITRSRALLRVARRLGSQALEADALHFSTDIWSSAIVIAGLLVLRLAEIWHLPSWVKQADAVAALGVSLIVISVALRLTRETVDALLDRAPEELLQHLEEAIRQVEGVSELRRIRVRRAGNKIFADVVVAAPRSFTFEETHALSERVEQAAIAGVHAHAPQAEADVVVHLEPVASAEETVREQIHYLAQQQGIRAHDIRVREVGGKLEADFDIEVEADMDLASAHAAATRLEEAVLRGNAQLQRVTTHLEAPTATIERRQDVTSDYPEMVQHIRQLADAVAGPGSAHDIHLYRSCRADERTTGTELCKERRQGEKLASANGREDELDLVLHITCAPEIPLSQAHLKAEEVQRALRQEYPRLGSVAIHTEPPE
ncbi:MAG: cation diffusion facilitator family transporter [Thermogemmatispora sp.]|uniref:cation diffusion facilitator family transporter n=1 Tax=Thermogemmatispora sp. TaxID=1968838 RepID=UPI00261C9A6F|nr:cation diffusion facilitator family transporter [Thermogemmatispora sp.]MBX5456660.1 cation diffusion facilitator family transporter [Thermogemmatispora sp.]